MNSSRFTRTGRIRFIYNVICLLCLVLLVLFLAIFQNTQSQLDDSRESNLHLQQQIEDLNNRLQASIEEKVILKKNIDNERQGCMNLEQKLKKIEDACSKDQEEFHEAQRKYDEIIKQNEAEKSKEQKECHDIQHDLEKRLKSLQEESAKEINECHYSLHNITDELKKLQIAGIPAEQPSHVSLPLPKNQLQLGNKSGVKPFATKSISVRGNDLQKNSSTSTTTTTTVPKANLKQVSANSTSTKPTSRSDAHKLPDNVAPIPANFDELIQDVAKVRTKKNKEVDTKFVNKQDVDSGAHEIKDQENNMNDDDFNLAGRGGNFFDDADKSAGKLKMKPKDDTLAAGGAIGVDGIAIGALDGNNLNNEIAGDQGKEFPDGLHLDEGIEEEEDEDDYSNPGARLQGAQAIRI